MKDDSGSAEEQKLPLLGDIFLIGRLFLVRIQKAGD